MMGRENGLDGLQCMETATTKKCCVVEHFTLLGFKGACGIWGGEEERREEHTRGIGRRVIRFCASLRLDKREMYV